MIYSTAMKVLLVNLILLALCDLSFAHDNSKKKKMTDSQKKSFQKAFCAMMGHSQLVFCVSCVMDKEEEISRTDLYNKCSAIISTAIEKEIPMTDIGKIVRMYGPRKHAIDKRYDLADLEKLSTVFGIWKSGTIISFLHCTQHTRNRGELATQALAYADVGWWEKVLTHKHVSMVIKTTLKLDKIIARPIFKRVFEYYTKLLEANDPNSNIYDRRSTSTSQYCSEQVLMTILEFTAKRESLVADEVLHMMFEVGCKMCPGKVGERYYCKHDRHIEWQNLHIFLSDDRLAKAPQFIVNTFLAYNRIKTLVRVWPIPAIISMVIKCKDESCILNTLNAIRGTGEQVDLDAFRGVITKTELFNVDRNDMLVFIEKLFDDNYGENIAKKIFSTWNDKLYAFLFFLYDCHQKPGNSLPTLKEFLQRTIANKWTNQSTMDFIYKSQEIKLFSEQYKSFNCVLQETENYRVMTILTFLEQSNVVNHDMWKAMCEKNLNLKVYDLVGLANRCCHFKKAVAYYLTNPEIKNCDLRTIESIGIYVTATDKEGATAEHYNALFNLACQSGTKADALRMEIEGAKGKGMSRKQLTDRLGEIIK